ncbi:MAG: ABC transporter ATP-binding protein [Firmicutes bacterium]|nr:ABC transporter ATP-binding protein [Bacillota bacterium]
MDYVIKTENLSRRFGDTIAVDKLNLHVPRGSIFGFLGPNGAGKTTTIRMLLGLARISAGEAWVLGQKVTTATDAAWLQKVGFLPDVPNFYNWMRGDEFLRLSGQLFGIPGPELNKRVEELLEATALRGVKTRIGGYSRGMKQRLGLAQALINNPELLFLDEPTSALDPIGRREMLESIKLLSEKTTVFFSTHILSDVERICDRVAILKSGRLITEQAMATLREQHMQSAVTIEIDAAPEPLIAALAAKPWSERVEETDNKIRVTIYDIAAARREIPGLIDQLQLPLRRFEPAELTLEDIFLKLVNGND